MLTINDDQLHEIVSVNAKNSSKKAMTATQILANMAQISIYYQWKLD